MGVENYKNIPEVLKKLPQWVCFKLDRNGKIPYNPVTGYNAKANDPNTWTDYETAVNAVKNGLYDGIGIEFANGLCGVDLDNVINDGKLTAEAQDIIKTLDSYTEYSPSGTGLHILFRGTIPNKDRRNGKIEMYSEGRFFTVTGKVFENRKELYERTKQAAEVHSKYIKRPQIDKSQNTNKTALSLIDSELIKKACNAKNGITFKALYNGDRSGYPSQSEADQAFCNMLAFWTGCNIEQMDRIFRQSGLMRDKWDRQQSGTTYGAITINKAVADCKNTYNPQEHIKKQDYKIEIITDRIDKKLADMEPERKGRHGRYGFNDIGNGNLFADYYKDCARYSPERKKWFIYNGAVWKADIGDLKVMQLCKKLADNLMIYAISIKDETQKEIYINSIKKWQKRNYRETILKDAASVYPIEITQFDKDPYIFNCINGTLNLQTGEFYPHKATDFLTKMADVKFDPNARSERWEKFISEVMQDDQDKAGFLQKALGYSLTGDTRFECFFVLYGATSRNGKGTTMETFMKLVGDYGKSARPDSIAQKQTANGAGPSEDIARLAGARFVNISEPDKKLILSAALVKTLTGNDEITARFLNENSFSYYPQFKLFINTNHLPSVTDVTLFSSGRVKIIPFERHFNETEQDKGLKNEFAKPENLSGILNWCLHGLNLIKEKGFETPEAVRIATEDYRKNNDKIGRFVDDEMEPGATAEVRTSEVYRRYKQWCQNNGFFPENAANFKASLSNIATIKRKRPAAGGEKTSLLLGYQLKPEYTLTNEPTPWG